MIKMLEDAIEKVRVLPADRQVLAAVLLDQVSDPDAIYTLTDAERIAVREGWEELDRGERASADEVQAVFDKYRS